MSNYVIIGTSRGIGKELVLQLAQDKDNTIFALSRTKSTEFQMFDNIHFHALDLNSNSVRLDAEKIFSALSSIDYLVNNAGVLVNKPFLEITADDLTMSYQTNVIGAMQVVQAAVPLLMKKNSHILNISSMGGFQGSVKFAGLSAYSTSKAALCSFTELFSEEYKETTISMNCLCLGAVQTEMLQEAFPGYEAPHSAKKAASYILDFLKNGHQFFRGKILPVSISTP